MIEVFSNPGLPFRTFLKQSGISCRY